MNQPYSIILGGQGREGGEDCRGGLQGREGWKDEVEGRKRGVWGRAGGEP